MCVCVCVGFSLYLNANMTFFDSCSYCRSCFTIDLAGRVQVRTGILKLSVEELSKKLVVSFRFGPDLTRVASLPHTSTGWRLSTTLLVCWFNSSRVLCGAHTTFWSWRELSMIWMVLLNNYLFNGTWWSGLVYYLPFRSNLYFRDSWCFKIVM